MINHRKYLKRAVGNALKSGCVRGKRGVVIVKDGRIIVEGYNSVYPTEDHCRRHGCLRDKLGLQMGQEVEKTRAVHAEALAVAEAAKKGIVLEGAVIYITCMPCINCAKLILASGMKEVYYLDLYGDRVGEKFLVQMGAMCKRMRLKGDRIETRLRDTGGQE